MKGACVCAARGGAGARRSGPFEGELVIVAIGLHEAPGGRGEDLDAPARRAASRADYAVVCEMSRPRRRGRAHGPGDGGDHDHAARDADARAADAEGHAAPAARGGEGGRGDRARAARSWRRPSTRGSAPRRTSSARCTAATSTTAGPTSCRIVGTRRWAPGNTLEAVDAEYRALLDAVAAETGCDDRARPEARPRRVRDRPGAPALLALAESYREVTGKTLEPVGMKVVADGALFAAAGIPTVYHGPVGSGAHADVEYMAVARARARGGGLPRAARGGSCDRSGWMPSRELGER